MNLLGLAAALFQRLMVGTIIGVALISLLLRHGLPLLEQTRGGIEFFGSQWLQQRLTIRQIEAEMSGLQPRLVLHQVELNDPDGGTILFQRLTIGIDLEASWQQGLPILSELELAGLQLQLLRDPQANIVVAGFSSSAESSSQGNGAVLAWLLGQPQLTVVESSLQFDDQLRGLSYTVPAIDLTLQRQEAQHQLFGRLQLPLPLGGGLRFMVNFTDNPPQLSRFYVDATLMQPLTLLAPAQQQWLQGETLIADLELWGEVNQDGVVDLVGRYQGHASGVLEPILPSHATLHWQPTGSGGALQVAELQFHGRDAARMPSQLQLNYDRPGEGELRLDRLALEPLSDLLGGLPAEGLGLPEGLWLKGSLGPLSLSWGATPSLLSRVEGLGVGTVTGAAAISGLAGSMQLSPIGGTVDVSSTDALITLPTLFEQPLSLASLQGRMEIASSAEGWRLYSSGMLLNTEHLAAAVEGEVVLPPQAPMALHLNGTFSMNEVAALPRYLPTRVMGEGATWLQHAFSHGRVSAGRLLLEGEGPRLLEPSHATLLVRLDAAGVGLNFHPQWPAVEAIDGTVEIRGSALTVAARRGRMLDADLRGVDVHLQDLREPYLELHGEGELPAADILRLIHRSPLEGIIGGGLGMLSLQGQAGLRLELGIPLSSDPGADRGGLRVDGDLLLRQVSLEVGEQLKFTDINGLVAFDQRGISAPQLKAQLWQQPLTATIYRQPDGSGEQTVIAGVGRVSSSGLSTLIPPPWQRLLEGETRWQASLGLPTAQHGEMRLSFHSDLEGMALRLPQPLTKRREGAESLDLQYVITGPHQGELYASLGERLSMALVTTPAEMGVALQRLHLQLGGGEAQLPDSELIRVTGEAEGVDVTGWRALAPAGGGGPQLPLEVTMKRLQLLRDLPVAAEGNGPGALLDDTPLPEPESQPKGMTGDAADQLLTTAGVTPPPIQLSIDSLGYGAVELGKLQLTTHLQEDGLVIDSLALQHEKHQLEAVGGWRAEAGMALQWKLTAPNVGNSLLHLGYNSSITRGALIASGDIAWLGGPTDFTLLRASGKTRMDITDGFMKQVGGGAGKLIGLLSLRSIPKRLFLDFSDLYEDGIDFNYIKGDIALQGGNLTTDNLRMKSIPADMLITGRTGLIARDLDHQITIVPNLSDTVTVAGALAWGPQVAATMFLIQKLFERNIDAASMRLYQLKGGWDAPQLDRVVTLDREADKDE